MRRRSPEVQCMRCLRRHRRCVRVNFARRVNSTIHCSQDERIYFPSVFPFRLSVHLATVYYAISTDVETARPFSVREVDRLAKISPEFLETISRWRSLCHRESVDFHIFAPSRNRRLSFDFTEGRRFLFITVLRENLQEIQFISFDIDYVVKILIYKI